MKQISIQQTNYTKLFEEEHNEPIIVKNTQGKQFLILPLEEIRWQKIFFQLYQLPSELFEKQPPRERDMDIIDKLYGSMKGKLSSSEEFSKRKQEEKELEERKWKR